MIIWCCRNESCEWMRELWVFMEAEEVTKRAGGVKPFALSYSKRKSVSISDLQMHLRILFVIVPISSYLFILNIPVQNGQQSGHRVPQ